MIIILGLILCGYLLCGKHNNLCKNIKKIRALVLLGCCILIFLLNDNLYDMVFSKLSSDDVKFASTLARAHSSLANIDIFLDHVLLGCGIHRYAELLSHYYELHGLLSLIGKDIGTNSMLINFAMYGIVFGFVYLYGLFSFCKVLIRGTLIRWWMLIIFVLMLSAEPLQMSLLFNALPFWGMNNSYNVVSALDGEHFKGEFINCA